MNQQKIRLKQGDTVQIHGVVTVKLDANASGGYAVTEDEGNKHFFVDEADGDRTYPVVWPGQNGPVEDDLRPYYLKPVPAVTF